MAEMEGTKTASRLSTFPTENVRCMEVDREAGGFFTLSSWTCEIPSMGGGFLSWPVFPLWASNPRYTILPDGTVTELENMSSTGIYVTYAITRFLVVGSNLSLKLATRFKVHQVHP